MLQNHNGGYTVNSINPFRIEGQKTIPFRALEYLEMGSTRLDCISWRSIRKYI